MTCLHKIRPIILTLWLHDMWAMPTVASIETKIIDKNSRRIRLGW